MPIPFALIPAAIQGLVGVRQLLGGNDQLNSLERPVYEIPGEARQTTGLARAEYADPRFAGQANLERQTNLNTANALETARARGGGQYQVGAIQSQANQASQQIAAEQARQQRQDRDQYMNALRIMSQYRDQEFQLNKMAPYMDQYNEARERIGAGQQNIFGAFDTAATIATRLLSASQGQGLNGQVVNQASGSSTGSVTESDLWQTPAYKRLTRIN